MHRHLLLCLVATLLVTGVARGQQTREQQVLADRKKFETDPQWIYNDLSRGFAEAKKTGKPLLVVLRCIPCKECVKLDDDLVNQDKHVRPLLEKFVCVRVVSTNGLDLSLFQFDYDQSFAVFLLNADGTVYGRYGTRSHRTFWSDDVSVEGLAKALEGALELHQQYPKNKAELVARKGTAPEFASPEKYPLLKDKYGPKLNYEANVAQSCIHCHQIGDAQRQLYRDRKQPIPEEVLFPYPHPKSLGLILDPKERATVLRVDKDSPAVKAGFQKGDAILRLEGQPLLSIADVQWVLHHTSPQGAALKAQVQRNGKTVELVLNLPRGWRHLDDISWRVSTWGLRRMVLGGMILENLTAEERKTAGVGETGMALRVKFLGNNGPHGAAMRAGFLKGDVLIAFDARTDLLRETDVIAHALSNRQVGDRLPVMVLRDGKKITLMLPMQD
jgi:hypothetical protein